MRAKKVVGIICVIIAGVIILGTVAEKIIEHRLVKLSQSKIAAIDLNAIRDGEYVGSFKIFPISVRTKTVISNHRIDSIRILEHRSGQGKPAEAIVNDILRLQRIDVDVISGASYSSRAIQKAVEKSLLKK